jgi:hypothetical protein
MNEHLVFCSHCGPSYLLQWDDKEWSCVKDWIYLAEVAVRTSHPVISDSVPEELDHPFVRNRPKEVTNVRIKHPAHFLPRDPNPHRIQYIMLSRLPTSPKHLSETNSRMPLSWRSQMPQKCRPARFVFLRSFRHCQHLAESLVIHANRHQQRYVAHFAAPAPLQPQAV